MFPGTRLFPVVCLLSISWVTSAPAGLLDWIFPLRAERQARRAAMRVGTNPPLTPAFGGSMTGGPFYGAGNYYPAYGAWAQPTLPLSTAATAPTTAFRTIMTPIPVTSFRPSDGGTCLQPCTSFEWQAQRVPTLIGGGIYGGSAGTSCGCAPSTSAMHAGWTTVGAGLSTAGCAACSTSPAITTAYGSTSSAWITPTSSTGASSDWMPVTAGASHGACTTCASPTTSSETSSGGSSAARATEWRRVDAAEPQLQPVPADSAPQLPANLEDRHDSADQTYLPPRNAGRGSAQPPAAGLVRVPSARRTADTTTGQYAGASSEEPPRRPLPPVNNARDFELSRGHRQESSTPATGATSRGGGFDSGFARDQRDGEASDAADRQQPASPMQLLRPIPDPERDALWQGDAAPQLLGPRDRTAAARPMADPLQASSPRRSHRGTATQARLSRQPAPPTAGRRPQLMSASTTRLTSAQQGDAAAPAAADRTEGWRSVRGK